MNNGANKGGMTEAMATIESSPGLEDFWALHWSAPAGLEYNPLGRFIVNLETPEATADFISILLRRRTRGHARAALLRWCAPPVVPDGRALDGAITNPHGGSKWWQRRTANLLSPTRATTSARRIRTAGGEPPFSQRCRDESRHGTHECVRGYVNRSDSIGHLDRDRDSACFPC